MSRALKKVLPPSWISPLKRAAAATKVRVFRLLSRSRFLSSLYYAMASNAFRREHRAVMEGLLRHHDTGGEGTARFFQLRRNVHRLEKALLMRPRREVFGLDYIGETVDYFRDCQRLASDTTAETLRWANDVLHTYFDAVGDHRLVTRARTAFHTVSTQQDPSNRIPYRRVLQVDPVHYDDLLALAQRRRSVRWFLPDTPGRDLIDKALAIATQAPSACNRQPFHFRIFDDPEMVQKVAAIPLGTAGFRENIPMIAVVVGDLSAYFSERDRHGVYVDASLAIMAFMFGLETLGVSTCPLNWPDIGLLERRMSRLLDLDAYERVIMLIAIGYPDPEAMVAYSQKRPLSEIRSFNAV